MTQHLSKAWLSTSVADFTVWLQFDANSCTVFYIVLVDPRKKAIPFLQGLPREPNDIEWSFKPQYHPPSLPRCEYEPESHALNYPIPIQIQ